MVTQKCKFRVARTFAVTLFLNAGPPTGVYCCGLRRAVAMIKRTMPAIPPMGAISIANTNDR